MKYKLSRHDIIVMLSRVFYLCTSALSLVAWKGRLPILFKFWLIFILALTSRVRLPAPHLSCTSCACVLWGSASTVCRSGVAYAFACICPRLLPSGRVEFPRRWVLWTRWYAGCKVRSRSQMPQLALSQQAPLFRSVVSQGMDVRGPAQRWYGFRGRTWACAWSGQWLTGWLPWKADWSLALCAWEDSSWTLCSRGPRFS